MKFVYNEKVEKIAEEARLAKTNEELAAVCQKLNISDLIVLDKVDLWLAKLSLSAIYRTLKKYPKLRDSINYFGTHNGFIKNKDSLFARLNKGIDQMALTMVKNHTDDIAKSCKHSFENNGLALAFYVGGSCSFSGIIINGKTLNEQSILKNLQYSESAGHYPKCCNTIKSVMEHEIGHLFDFKLGISGSKEFNDFIRQYGIEDIKRGLSGYCVMNNAIANGEVVADGYSEYCNNPKPRKIASMIGEIFERRYKEVLR